MSASAEKSVCCPTLDFIVFQTQDTPSEIRGVLHSCQSMGQDNTQAQWRECKPDPQTNPPSVYATIARFQAHLGDPLDGSQSTPLDLKHLK